MGRLRHGVRRLVLGGASLLREARAGVGDAVSELSSTGSIERDLQEARRHGRWLTEEEQAQALLLRRRQRKRRMLLRLLLVISVLLPPLWLSLPIWIGLLWFPKTTRRLLIAGLVVAVAGAGVGLLILLWLLIR
ncbi:MAG: hypothetical protein ACKOHJ_03270 [Vulcanococcus sp.]